MWRNQGTINFCHNHLWGTESTEDILFWIVDSAMDNKDNLTDVLVVSQTTSLVPFVFLFHYNTQNVMFRSLGKHIRIQTCNYPHPWRLFFKISHQSLWDHRQITIILVALHCQKKVSLDDSKKWVRDRVHRWLPLLIQNDSE